jgi:hypothetical protein
VHCLISTLPRIATTSMALYREEEVEKEKLGNQKTNSEEVGTATRLMCWISRHWSLSSVGIRAHAPRAYRQAFRLDAGWTDGVARGRAL